MTNGDAFLLFGYCIGYGFSVGFIVGLLLYYWRP